MEHEWLKELNPAQRDAVTHAGGPLLIIAGAGTGKTKTLACRVAYLIERGVAPERILLLTFTRRAAAEMLRRAGQLTAGAASGQVWGGTFHSVANRLLRIYAGPLGLASDFTVMDRGDSADLMNLLRGELGHAEGDRRFPRKDTLVSIYSRTVNAQEKLEGVLERHFPWCADARVGIAEIFQQYTARKREHNLLDYDDLLLFWAAACETPEVGPKLSDRFDHILVDEYQDTNAIQAQILRGMRQTRPDICVVGDDAQAIYSFRAATVRNILDFPRHFADTRRVTLEQNYRSIPPILDASNAVMEQAAERYTKNLWSQREGSERPWLVTCADEPQQTEAVCAAVLEHLEQGIPLMQQAVLFRAAHHSAQLEIELARRNIPFHKFGGLKFVEAAHIKDMLAFLRIVENPRDELSWYRVLQMLTGIGPRTARRIMDVLLGRAERHRHAAGGSALTRLFRQPPDVPPAAGEQFAALRRALADCSGVRLNGHAPNGAAEPGAAVERRAATPELPEQIETLRRFYEPIFQKMYDDAVIRLRDIEQLQAIASRYRSRGRFISDLTLDPPAATSDLAQPPHLDEDWLTLSTIHSAKGCEWDTVHVLHAADGMIPSDMAVGDAAGVDEERRLFYVAMTRAKNGLYVYFPLRYYHRRYAMGDGHSYAQLTRFITPEVRARFRERVAGEEVAADEVEQSAGRNALDKLNSKLNDLWGGA